MPACFRMNRTIQYNQSLMDIKSKIKSNPTALEDIKFCCGNIEGFSASDLERINTMTDLYRKLQELDLLNEDNTTFLKGILASNNFNACVAILERYENGGYQPGVQPHVQPVQQPQPNNGSANIRQSHGPVIQPNPSEDLAEAFDLIVDNIGRDWRRLVRRLPGSKLSETDIEVLTDRHSRDLREQSRGALVLWQSKNPQLATKNNLIDVLKACEMNYIADMLEGWQLR